MNPFAILGGALALLSTGDIVRMRARAGALQVLAPCEAPASESHVFIVRAGVTLDEATRRAASAYATAHGIEVLDLVSPKIESWRAAVLLLAVDPAKYRRDRIARGVSVGDAMLVDASVLARAKAGARIDTAPSNAVGLAELALVLKRYATTTTDLAVAPSLESPRLALRERRRLLRILFGELVGSAVGLQLTALAAAVTLEPISGLFALALGDVSVLAGTAGTPLKPRDRFLYPFIRPLVDLASAFGPLAPSGAAGETPSLRVAYEDLLKDGTGRFFEPPRDDCPMCGGRALTRELEVGDRFQFKPGRFAVDRCDACAHRFQNPRLSLEGLSFYYKDFYDGLGEELLEGVFASEPKLYLQRARMVADVAKPGRWLDVGAGHGHFCNVAKDVFPETTFDGLDLSDSIEDAERRRWVTRGIRGLFPDVAPALAEEGTRYDVVSMSHYLEHTLDPRSEIAAASRLLEEGGLLFIELPDPESRFGKLLGTRWMPWFQPQHINFLSTKNLERLLEDAGFEPFIWHRGEAHQPCDLTFSTFMILEQIAPQTGRPWLPPSGAVAQIWRRVVWTAAIPAFATAWGLDHLLAPLARRPGWANTYRVLARKTAVPAAVQRDEAARNQPPRASTLAGSGS